jgi:hypothetical protein
LPSIVPPYAFIHASIIRFNSSAVNFGYGKFSYSYSNVYTPSAIEEYEPAYL